MLNILIISKDGSLQKLMRQLMGRWFPGVNIVAATSQKSALRVNASLHPEIVLLDMSMPARGDVALIQEIKADNDSAALLVLSYCTYREYFDGAIASDLVSYFDIASNSLFDELRSSMHRIFEHRVAASGPSTR